jgi:hypothetical protein
VSKKLKQTILACLAPPKVSMKARFMNVHRLVMWANKILKLDVEGPDEKGSLLGKLRASLCELPQCKEFITAFIRDVIPLMECQKIIKSQGLSDATYAQCQKLIEMIPPTSSIRLGFDEWAIQQLGIAKTLGRAKLPISTDQIESLFGLGKSHGTGEVKDANRIATRLAALCGTFTRDDARKVLDITVQQQQELMSTDTLIKQRRHALAHNEQLETLLSSSEKQHIELIPESKNRVKTNVTPCNIYNIFNFNGPYDEAALMPIECTTFSFKGQSNQISLQKLDDFFDG